MIAVMLDVAMLQLPQHRKDKKDKKGCKNSDFVESESYRHPDARGDPNTRNRRNPGRNPIAVRQRDAGTDKTDAHNDVSGKKDWIIGRQSQVDAVQ